jgi:FkbM family methyltransferase
MSASIMENLILTLPTVTGHHAPTAGLYGLLKTLARREVEQLFSGTNGSGTDFKPFGHLHLPYHKMGAVDSLNLFDLDELIIFSFYWANRDNYSRALDIGANIGLHSILMSKLGMTVRSFEPDPVHFAILKRNLELNGCTKVQADNAAVSSQSGVHEFTRVCGNTTGSHLTGSKPNPYGELEKFQVRVESIGPLLRSADLVKLDAEGHEKEILLATRPADWRKTDALVEIGSAENTAEVYQHFHGTGVNLFSQKTNWQLVRAIADMPTSHHDGSVFITYKTEMPWNGPGV